MKRALLIFMLIGITSWASVICLTVYAIHRSTENRYSICTTTNENRTLLKTILVGLEEYRLSELVVGTKEYNKVKGFYENLLTRVPDIVDC